MRKTLLLICILVPAAMYSQNNFMAIGFGGNVPLQDFSGTENIYRHGFASNGFEGDYSGAFFKTGQHLGIRGNIRYSSNTLRENELVRLLQAEIPAEINFTGMPEYSTGLWKYVSILAGPEYTIPFQNMNIDLYLTAGINFIFNPDMGVKVGDGDNSFQQVLEIRTLNPAFETGFAFRFHLSEKTSIRIYSGWFYSISKGEVVRTILNQGIQTIEKTDYICPVTNVHGGIGLAYRL